MKKQTPTFSVSEEIGMQATKNNIPSLISKLKENRLDRFITKVSNFLFDYKVSIFKN